jgi:hypothetical protein
MYSDGPGSARIKIPKEGAFSLRKSKKEREEGSSFGLGMRREAANLTPRYLGPSGTRHARTVHDDPADGPRGARTVRTSARTVRYMLQNIQYRPSSPQATRTVRQERPDSPAHCRGQSDLLFHF